MLTRDQILACSDVQEQVVPVPEWGGDVLMIGLSAAEYDKYESGLFEMRKNQQRMTMQNARARLVVRCAHGDDRRRLFADADAEALGQKSSLVLSRLFKIAQQLCGTTEKDDEDLEKNLEKVHAANSASG